MEASQVPSHPNTTLSASDDTGAEKLDGSQKDSKDLAVDDTSEPTVDFEKSEEVHDGLVPGAGDPTAKKAEAPTGLTPKPEETPDWITKRIQEEAAMEDDDDVDRPIKDNVDRPTEDDVDRPTEDEKSVLPKVTEKNMIDGGEGGGTKPTADDKTAGLEKVSKEDTSHESPGSDSKEAQTPTALTPQPTETPDRIAKRIEEGAAMEDGNDVDRPTKDEKSVLPKATEQNMMDGLEGGATNSTADDRTAGVEKEPGVV